MKWRTTISTLAVATITGVAGVQSITTQAEAAPKPHVRTTELLCSEGGKHVLPAAIVRYKLVNPTGRAVRFKVVKVVNRQVVSSNLRRVPANSLRNGEFITWGSERGRLRISFKGRRLVTRLVSVMRCLEPNVSLGRIACLRSGPAQKVIFDSRKAKMVGTYRVRKVSADQPYVVQRFLDVDPGTVREIWVRDIETDDGLYVGINLGDSEKELLTAGWTASQIPDCD